MRLTLLPDGVSSAMTPSHRTAAGAGTAEDMEAHDSQNSSSTPATLRRLVGVSGGPVLALGLQGFSPPADVVVVPEAGPRPSVPPVDATLPLPWHRALPLLGFAAG